MDLQSIIYDGMKITNTLTDTAISTELARRVQRARLDHQLTQADLAQIAGLARPTIERFETTGVAQLTTLVRILRALGLADRLDMLLSDVNIRPVEALKTYGAGRKRAYRPRGPETLAKPWTWGDQR